MQENTVVSANLKEVEAAQIEVLQALDLHFAGSSEMGIGGFGGGGGPGLSGSSRSGGFGGGANSGFGGAIFVRGDNAVVENYGLINTQTTSATGESVSAVDGAKADTEKPPQAGKRTR